jgi:hypothetical protein
VGRIRVAAFFLGGALTAGSAPKPASNEHEAFHRLARRMFATRLVEKHRFADPTRRLTKEQIETVLWESERFAVFPVVFDPTGIATLARVSLRQGVKKEFV